MLFESISKWLKSRSFYVHLDVNDFYVRYCDVRNVQGLVHGPILYALFVSPLFDLIEMTSFTGENYAVRWNKQLPELIKTWKNLWK